MADPLETAQYFIFVTQAYFCSMYAVVLWDWIISLPREWIFVWRTRWSPVKAAYLFCRYWVIAVIPYLLYCFVMDHTQDVCNRIYPIPVALALWNQAGADSAVLLIRTYAFFNRNNYLLAVMICALLGMIAYQLYVATSQMLPLPFVKPPYTAGPCLPMSKPHSEHLLFFFLAPLMFDTAVTFLTVLKATSIRRQSGAASSSRLIQTFLREGVFYYILISIANLVNGIFYLQPRQVISAINIPLSVMLSPVLACRLILDLRERGSEAVAFSGTHPFSSGNRSGTNFQFSPQMGNTFSTPRTNRTFTSTTPKSLNAGLTFATFGSVSGVDVGDLELSSVGRSPGRVVEDKDYESDDGDIGDYCAVELGISGIRIDVEKTYQSS